MNRTALGASLLVFASSAAWAQTAPLSFEAASLKPTATPDTPNQTMRRLLGGPGWFPNKLRDLTDIERTLMQRFMARMLNSYRESWNYLLTLSLKIEALDSNPQFIPRIIPLDQIVAYVSMELKIGDMAGVMNFCLPYLVLQSISQQLTDFQWSPTVMAGRGMTEEDIAQLTRNVERADVEVEVELGQTMV